MITQQQKENLKLLARKLMNTAYNNGIIDEQDYQTSRRYRIAELATQDALHVLFVEIEKL